MSTGKTETIPDTLLNTLIDSPPCNTPLRQSSSQLVPAPNRASYLNMHLNNDSLCFNGKLIIFFQNLIITFSNIPYNSNNKMIDLLRIS